MKRKTIMQREVNAVAAYLHDMSVKSKVAQVADCVLINFARSLDTILREEGWRDANGLPYCFNRKRALYIDHLLRLIKRFRLPGPNEVRVIVENLRVPHIEACLYGVPLRSGSIERRGRKGTQYGPSDRQMLRTLNSRELELMIRSNKVDTTVGKIAGQPLGSRDSFRVHLVNIARVLRRCQDDRAKMRYLLIDYPTIDPYLVASVQPLLSLWCLPLLTVEEWGAYENANPEPIYISHARAEETDIMGVSLPDAWANRGIGKPWSALERSTVESIQLLGGNRFIPVVEIV